MLFFPGCWWLVMSSSHSDFMSQLFPVSCIGRLNTVLPPGFRFDPIIAVKKESKHVSAQKTLDSEHRPRKRSRPWQKEQLPVSGFYESSDREWGLRIGGDPARLCYSILQNVKRHALSGPFIQPVDPVALNLPDYLEIIKDPMDLSTVERNLKAGVYGNSQQFANDMRRIWLNAFTYNAHESEMFYIALELATYFEKQFKEAENLVFGTDSPSLKLTRDKESLLDYLDRPMSLQEKRLLATNLRRLNSREHALAIGRLVFGQKKILGPHFQFNIEKLPPRICRELEKYVKLTYQAACRANRQRNLAAFKRSY